MLEQSQGRERERERGLYSHTNQRTLQIGKIEIPKVGKSNNIPHPSTYPSTNPSYFPTRGPTLFPTRVIEDTNNKNSHKNNPAQASAPSSAQVEGAVKTSAPTILAKRVRVIALPSYDLSFKYDVHIGDEIASSTLLAYNEYINRHFKELAFLPGTSKDAVSGVTFLTESEMWGTEGISRRELNTDINISDSDSDRTGASDGFTSDYGRAQTKNYSQRRQRKLQLGEIGDQQLEDWSSVSLQYDKLMHVRFKTTFIITYKTIDASNMDDDTLNVSDGDMRVAMTDMIQSYFEKSTHSDTPQKEIRGLQNLSELKFGGFVTSIDNNIQQDSTTSSAQSEGEFLGEYSPKSQILYGFLGAFLAIVVCLMASYSKRRRRMPQPTMDEKNIEIKQTFSIKNILSLGKKKTTQEVATSIATTRASTEVSRYPEDYPQSGMCGVMNCIDQDSLYDENKSHSRNIKQKNGYGDESAFCGGLCIG